MQQSNVPLWLFWVAQVMDCRKSQQNMKKKNQNQKKNRLEKKSTWYELADSALADAHTSIQITSVLNLLFAPRNCPENQSVARVYHPIHKSWNMHLHKYLHLFLRAQGSWQSTVTTQVKICTSAHNKLPFTNKIVDWIIFCCFSAPQMWICRSYLQLGYDLYPLLFIFFLIQMWLHRPKVRESSKKL